MASGKTISITSAVIALLIITFGCFALGVSLYLQYSLNYHFGALKEKDLNRRIQNHAMVIEHYLDHQQQWLGELSEDPGLIQILSQPERLRGYLNRLQQLAPGITLRVLTPQGQPLLADNGAPPPRTIKALLKGGEPAHFAALKTPQGYRLLLAHTIDQNNRTQGVLVGEITSEALINSVHPVPEQAEEALQLLYNQGSLDPRSADARIYSDYQLNKYPLKLVGYLDNRELQDTSQKILAQVSAVIGLVALAIMALTFFVSRYLFIAPIDQLHQATDMIASGQPARRLFSRLTSARLRLQELASLSQAIDAMSAIIRTREKALQQVNLQLEQRVQERTAQLQTARDRALTATRAKSDFLATMSHEIRTPMHAVLGIFDLLQATELTDEQKRWLQTAHSGGELLLGIINDILDFSALEAGKLTLKEDDFDPHQVFQQALALVQVNADQKGIALMLTLDDTIAHNTRGDQSRLAQVLLNLLGNAIKFTERGSVHLRVQRLSGDDNHCLLRVAIEDTGIGIAPEFQPRIFDQFTMKDQGHARTHAGTGLGLAICQRLVQLMGGQLSCTSEVGVGSTFTFTLPLILPNHPEPAPPAPNNSRRLSVDGHQPCILLAEDNPANQAIIRALLEHEGMQVSTVTEGQQALQAVQSTPFDLVLMDISMPQMDGISATQKIRQLPDTRQSAVPIIALTAHVMTRDQGFFLASGFNACLSKPVDKKTLINTLFQWLNPPVADPELIRVPPWHSLPHVDLAAVHQLARDTSSAQAAQLLRLYRQDARQRIEQLKTAIQTADIAMLDYQAHTLGSSGGAHGNPRVQACARYLEQLCRSPQWPQVQACARQLIHETEQALARLAKTTLNTE